MCSQEDKWGEKKNVLYTCIKGNTSLPLKEPLCPQGHVGLERNDSRCRPPETNCHWPPWIFPGHTRLETDYSISHRETCHFLAIHHWNGVQSAVGRIIHRMPHAKTPVSCLQCDLYEWNPSQRLIHTDPRCCFSECVKINKVNRE